MLKEPEGAKSGDEIIYGDISSVAKDGGEVKELGNR